MTNLTKETITTEENDNSPIVNTKVGREATGSQTVGYFVYFLFGVLEILLAFRLILRLLGANPSSGFVNFIYGLSKIFILPFQGIFHSGIAEGVETTSVFEPGTLIAIIVYAVLAWGIVKLIQIISGGKPETE